MWKFCAIAVLTVLIAMADARSLAAQQSITLREITPGVHTRADLYASERWGTPQDTHVDAEGRQYLIYAGGKLPVAVTIVDDQVHTMDLRIPPGTQTSVLVQGFGLGAPDDGAPPEASRVGLTPQADWAATYYPARSAVLYTKADAPQLLRFFPGRKKVPGCTINAASEAACKAAIELMDAGKLDEALRKFDEAIEHDPMHGCAHFNRAKCLILQGKSEQGLADARAAIKKIGEHRLSLAQYAMVLAQGRRFTESIEAATKTITLDGEYAFAYHQRGMSYAELGELDRAMADFDRVVELAPDDARGYCSRAHVYGVRSDFSRCLQEADKALERAPDFAEALLMQGFARLRLGRVREAIQSLNRSIELNPKRGYAYQIRSEARIRVGDFRGARSDRQMAARTPK